MPKLKPNKKPPKAILPKGKKRKPLKKAKPGLGPGPHHADHSKQKSFPVTSVMSPAGTTTDAYSVHTNHSARVHPPPTKA